MVTNGSLRAASRWMTVGSPNGSGSNVSWSQRAHSPGYFRSFRWTDSAAIQQHVRRQIPLPVGWSRPDTTPPMRQASGSVPSPRGSELAKWVHWGVVARETPEPSTATTCPRRSSPADRSRIRGPCDIVRDPIQVQTSSPGSTNQAHSAWASSLAGPSIASHRLIQRIRIADFRASAIFPPSPAGRYLPTVGTAIRAVPDRDWAGRPISIFRRSQIAEFDAPELDGAAVVLKPDVALGDLPQSLWP